MQFIITVGEHGKVTLEGRKAVETAAYEQMGVR